MSLNKYYQNKYGRRAVLRGIGAGALAPFLPILEADAQSSLGIKRFVCITTPNGIEDALPTGSETNFNFRDSLRSFDPHKSDITCIGGMDWKAFNQAKDKPSNNHTEPVPITLTGAFSVRPANNNKNNWTSARPSVDQYIAQRLWENQDTRTKFKSIIAGVKVTAWASKLIYAEANKPLSPENKPSNLHARMFDGLNPGTVNGGSGGEPDPAVLRALQARRSVLDNITADLTRINSRIGADDKVKMEAHLQSIREIETRLDFEAEQAQVAADSEAAEKGTACSIPSLKNEDGSFENNYRKEGENQMDIIANSFACDLTRVATLMWSNGTNQYMFPSKGVDVGHHHQTHQNENANKGNRIKTSQWYAERVLYLVEKLKSIPDGNNGTLFDSTAILWTSEHAGGGGHGRSNLPFTILGSMGGSIQTGRFLDFRKTGSNGRGRHNGDLYLSLIHAMGYTDLRSFGEPNLGDGVLPGFLT